MKNINPVYCTIVKKKHDSKNIKYKFKLQKNSS